MPATAKEIEDATNDDQILHLNRSSPTAPTVLSRSDVRKARSRRFNHTNLIMQTILSYSMFRFDHLYGTISNGDSIDRVPLCSSVLLVAAVINHKCAETISAV